VTECPKSSHEPASAREPIVFVSDDDASMRGALTNLFQSVGLKVEVFGSAPEMLHSKLPDVARLAIVENTAERELLSRYPRRLAN
jgi:DNA-binding NtrC family response regulator